MTKKGFSNYIAKRLSISEEHAKQTTNAIVSKYANNVLNELHREIEKPNEFLAAVQLQMIMFDDFIKKEVLTKDLADEIIKNYRAERKNNAQ